MKETDKNVIVAMVLSAMIIMLSLWKGQMLMGSYAIFLIVLAEIAYHIYLKIEKAVENKE